MKSEDEKKAVEIMIEAAKDTEFMEDAMLLGYRALVAYRAKDKPTTDSSWHPWAGYGIPAIEGTTLVEVQLRDGSSPFPRALHNWSWSHRDSSSDIMRYRIVKEAPKPSERIIERAERMQRNTFYASPFYDDAWSTDSPF
jgi:hypothetical protein